MLPVKVFGLRGIIPELIYRLSLIHICYQIQVSDDGDKWLIAAQGTVIESDEVLELLSPQNKRYLRLYVTSALKEPGFYEIGVFNKIAEIPKPTFGEGMYFEDPRGPLTKSEVDYFKAYASKANKFPLPTTNVGNQMVYGTQGICAEALAWMYKTDVYKRQLRERDIVRLLSVSRMRRTNPCLVFRYKAGLP